MNALDLLKSLLSALKPYEAQLAKKLWEDIIHPQLKALESHLGSGTVALVAASLDASLDKLVEDEIAKLSQP